MSRLENRAAMAGGAADQERNGAATLVAPFSDPPREGLAAEVLAVLVERHQHQIAALARQRRQQQLGLPGLELRLRQGALLLDLLELDRPAQALTIILIELARGPCL